MKKSWQSYEHHEPPVIGRQEPLCSGDGPYRPNVAALILRQRETVEVLLGERYDTPGAWQWSQGGIEENEDPLTALHREIAEEVGIQKVDIHYVLPILLRYRFPEALGAQFAPRIGQEQMYFVVTTKEEPDLAKAADREFCALRWSPLAQAPNSAIWFKQAVYTWVTSHVLQGLADGAIQPWPADQAVNP